MVYLVEVNRSFPAQEAMRAVAASARRDPGAEVVLLHVSPSGRPAEMESGRRLLDECRDRTRLMLGTDAVHTCLEVGNRIDRLAQTAERLAADCVVVGSHDAGEYPRLKELGESARAAVDRMTRPVLVVGQDGARRFEAQCEVVDVPRG